MQDKFANSYGIYEENIGKKLKSEQKNVFICYRGMYSWGGAIAQVLYYTILCSRFSELIPFCAPQNNKYVDFEKQSRTAMKDCNVFVPIFTDGFFDCEKGSDDQVRKEFIMLARKNKQKENNIHVVPVYVLEKKEIPLFLDEFKYWLMGKDGSESSDNCKINREIWKALYPDDVSDGDAIDSSVAAICEKLCHCSNYCSVSKGAVLVDELEKAVNTIDDLYHSRPKIGGRLVWIGTRLSDIEVANDTSADDSLFAGAITLFGKNIAKKNLYAMCDDVAFPSRRVDHNAVDAEQDDYIFTTAATLAEKEPNAKFYFYNQFAYYNVHSKSGARLCDALKGRCVCINEEALLGKLSNKRSFHENYSYIGNGKGLLDVAEAVYSDIEYGKLCKMLGADEAEECKFIVQEPVASGGSGTYILTKENEVELRKKFSQGNTYLCSVYRENNVPVNLHAIIFKDGIILTPGSVQVMRTDYDTIDGRGEVRRLMYRGADFIEYERIACLPDSEGNKVNGRHIEKFRTLCLELCERIKAEGYIGVLGIDGMIYGDEVRLLEVNCRFQASTALINRALQDVERPSLQKINLQAWAGMPSEACSYLSSLKVPYSNYSYNYIGENAHVMRVLSACKNTPLVCGTELDGYTGIGAQKEIKDNAHLFRLVFNTNICCVNEDGAVDLDECVSEPVAQFRKKIESLGTLSQGERASACRLLALKIALLTQGVKILPSAENCLKTGGGLRPATNDAADILFGEEFYNTVINAPLHNKFQDFSPFDIDTDDHSEGQSLRLLYYGKEIAHISLFNSDPLESMKTRKGFGYGEVAYLSTDRLRVHVTKRCIYKGNGTGCEFCNIQPGREEEIDDASISEVVKAHWSDFNEKEAKKERAKRRQLHFLIGGQSPKQNSNTVEKVCSIIRIIREAAPQGSVPNIYAMILPCIKNEDGRAVPDEQAINKLFEAGLTQLSFNIEIFDDIYAKKYMPGKGMIPRDVYFACLLAARAAWQRGVVPGRSQEVVRHIRSMVILGLEPRNSFMKGMHQLIIKGIQPIVSLFRPLTGTPLQDRVAPSMISVYKTFFALHDMIKGIRGDNSLFMLGPDCTYCQNNTLSLPEEIRITEEKE